MVEALLWFVDLVEIDGIFKTENYHRSFMQDAIWKELDFFCFSMIVIPNTLQIQYKHIWIGKHYQSWIPKAQTSTLLKQCWIILTENRKKRQATSNKEL